jgi:DNA mismatch repair protein MutL
MSQIRVLPEGLINQIAAGEVVERPSSVVKELVENALDAEATRVDVAIAGGGIRWISVQDDGGGLSRRDAEMAFERHATSKLSVAADLVGVTTLGFRGEALPSIASVARVRMRTRRSQDPVGTELVGEGQGIQTVSDVACPQGTRVEVSELFGKIPARRKFLKSEMTESTHVVRWLERIALARPDLRIELAREGRPAMLFPRTKDLRERAIAVLPPSVGERLVPIGREAGVARVSGFASPTDVRRGSTNDIHLFVNGRPVRDRLLLFAVREAYRDALPPGRHPVVVLHLAVDSGQVDVNVHPAKWEVRFREPDLIRRLVRDALVGGLGLGPRKHPLSRPQALWDRPETTTEDVGSADGLSPGSFVLGDTAHSGGWPAATDPGERTGARPEFSFSSLRYLGQILGTYLLFEGPSGLVLLDQHAAHERVLFERMRQAAFSGKLEGQVLLLPVWAELSRSAADALLSGRQALEAAGFDIEVGEGGLRGGIRVGIRAVPALLAQRPEINWPVLLEETAASLLDPAASESRDGLEGALHAVVATAACHAAVRKGDRLLPRDVEGLQEGLDEAVWFPNCPHGRPIMAVLEESELERRFLRR